SCSISFRRRSRICPMSMACSVTPPAAAGIDAAMSQGLLHGGASLLIKDVDSIGPEPGPHTAPHLSAEVGAHDCLHARLSDLEVQDCGVPERFRREDFGFNRARR